jgi:RNA recognition motif-containing protein
LRCSPQAHIHNRFSLSLRSLGCAPLFCFGLFQKGTTISSISTSIFIGNLNHSCTEDDLLAVFCQFGNVTRVTICTDRETGEPRGFAFVQFDSAEDAQRAIAALNGTTLFERTVTVNEARPNLARGRERTVHGTAESVLDR